MSNPFAAATATAAVGSDQGDHVLDQQLDLLESRFTEPHALLLGNNNNNNSNSNNSLACSTSPSLFSSNIQNSNLSEHSYSFSGSNMLHNPTPPPPPFSSTNPTNTATPPGGGSAALDRVSRAAERHMRKVQAAGGGGGTPSSPMMMNGNSNLSFSSAVGFANNNNSNSNSQQTVVTGNKSEVAIAANNIAHANANDIMVAESPPVVISPHCDNSATASGSTKKKPNVQRALPLLHENDENNNSNTNHNNSSGQEQQLQHVVPQKGATTAVGGGSASKRKPSNPKRKVSSITKSPMKKNNHIRTPSEGRGKGNAGGGGEGMRGLRSPTTRGRGRSPSSRSPNRGSFSSSNSFGGLFDTATTTTNSRSNGGGERSNGGGERSTSAGNKKHRSSGPPPNNKSMYDFFHPKNKTATEMTVGTAAATATGTATRTSATGPTTAAAAKAAAEATAVVEQWQLQCTQLQQQLHDKEEQLKAVTGNKTIHHMALQQALTKTRTELSALQDSTTKQRTKTQSLLEQLLREKFETNAKEIRMKLSQDGNRLGKIVSSRVGMMARVIDTWEEGYASKDWLSRKEQWKTQHTKLLDAQDKLKQRLKQQQQQQHTGDDDNTNGGSDSGRTRTNNDSVSTTTAQPIIVRMSVLDIEEAKEGIQMQLESLRRSEQELLAEEQSLMEEKSSHIRALKRVASEDSSRFRSRPNLHDRYVLDHLLGKGGFSEVWKGFDLQELREVAVKIHQLDPRWSDSKKENYTKHVAREYEIHRNVRHDRIVSLYDVFEIDTNSFATVLECCQGTDLDTLLKRKKRLPERHARAILLQILNGMKYLSSPSGTRQGIIHYDLKPGNILFDENGDAKITDFGLSKIVDTSELGGDNNTNNFSSGPGGESMELTSQGAGTYWYLPPECFVTGEGVPRISNKVDVWSIGVIFYQMLYGKRPFGEGQSQDKLLADGTMLNARTVVIPDKPRVSDAGQQFVTKCLTYEQTDRPTIAQLCDDPYLLVSFASQSSKTTKQRY